MRAEVAEAIENNGKTKKKQGGGDQQMDSDDRDNDAKRYKSRMRAQ